MRGGSVTRNIGYRRRSCRRATAIDYNSNGIHSRVRGTRLRSTAEPERCPTIRRLKLRRRGVRRSVLRRVSLSVLNSILLDGQ